MSTTKEAEMLKELNFGESMYYRAGLSEEPFAALPGLTLKTTKEEEDSMIDKLSLELCLKSGVNKTDAGFNDIFMVLHLMIELFTISYRDGLKAAQKK